MFFTSGESCLAKNVPFFIFLVEIGSLNKRKYPLFHAKIALLKILSFILLAEIASLKNRKEVVIYF